MPSDTTGDPAMDSELYRLWTGVRDGTCMEVDVGAATFIAHYLLTNHPPAEWRQEGDRLRPRVARILHTCAGRDPDRARSDAERIVVNALIAADDEHETRTIPAPIVAAPLVEHVATVMQRVVREAEHPTRVLPTPFPTLNHYLLGGFRPGELVYLGGRPGVGKSALASEIVRDVVRRTAEPALVVSCEMSNESTCRRLAAQDGRLDAAALRSGQGVDYAALAQTAARTHAYPLWFTDRVHTLAQIETTARTAPFVLVVVDYVQLLTGPRPREGQRIELEGVSKGLKRIAIERKCVVLALSSLSRIQERERPTLAALRNSGSLEHDADVVLLLHRPNLADDNAVECIVGKNRDGRTGTVCLNFRPKWVGFDEATPDVKYPEDWHDT